MALRLALLASVLAVSCVHAAERLPPAVYSEYFGTHRDLFTANLERVRLLTRQSQIEISARLGLLQYQDGFACPLSIRFQDGTPNHVVENQLAYVQMIMTKDGVRQELVIDLDSYSGNNLEFDKLFYHEMTHAIINDAMQSGRTQAIPHWVHEGLAQFVSGEGEDRIRTIAKNLPEEQAWRLYYDIDGPYSGQGYPQYYVTMKFIEQRGSINALQGFVRYILQGQSAEEAIYSALNMSYPQFKEQLKPFSIQYYERFTVKSPFRSTIRSY